MAAVPRDPLGVEPAVLASVQSHIGVNGQRIKWGNGSIPLGHQPPSGPGGLFIRTVGHRNPGATGAVNRSSSPDSVRYVSVTIVVR
jgi:hypothetical protein